MPKMAPSTDSTQTTAYPPTSDLEKAVRVESTSDSPDSLVRAGTVSIAPGRLSRRNHKIESLSGLEVLGVTRILPEERDPESITTYAKIFQFWFSANLAANNICLGMLWPLLFKLSLVDAACCAVGSVLLASFGIAYMTTWGPRTGNRTLVSLLFASMAFVCAY
jgi:hypothetical protein